MPRANLRFKINGDLPEGVSVYLAHVGLQNRVQMVDISLAGVAVLVDRDSEATAAIVRSIERRDTLTLILEAPCLHSPVAVAVQPIHSQEVRGKVLVGGKLLPSIEQRRALESAMERIFNRRSAVRGYAPAFAQPSATLSIPGTPAAFAGRLRDLSLSGAGLLLDPAAAGAVTLGSGCRLALDLEPGDEPLRMGGLVRQVRAGNGELIVGVEFDPAVAGRPANARRIYRWVTERQLDERRVVDGPSNAA